MQSKSVLVTQNCYIQLDRLAWVRGRVFCTLGAQKPPPRASCRAEKSENTQKRYETGRRYLKQKGLRSLCGPPKPPHGHIWPRQRLAHLRVDVEGRHERLYRPRPRTWDRANYGGFDLRPLKIPRNPALNQTGPSYLNPELPPMPA